MHDVPHAWREKLVLNITQTIGFRVLFTNQTEDLDTTSPDAKGNAPTGPVLYWLPFLDISRARFDLHPYRGFGPTAQADEMTHYCHTPLLWAPVYAGIARGLAYDRWRKANTDS